MRMWATKSSQQHWYSFSLVYLKILKFAKEKTTYTEQSSNKSSSSCPFLVASNPLFILMDNVLKQFNCSSLFFFITPEIFVHFN